MTKKPKTGTWELPTYVAYPGAALLLVGAVVLAVIVIVDMAKEWEHLQSLNAITLAYLAGVVRFAFGLAKKYNNRRGMWLSLVAAVVPAAGSLVSFVGSTSVSVVGSETGAPDPTALSFTHASAIIALIALALSLLLLILDATGVVKSMWYWKKTVPWV